MEVLAIYFHHSCSKFERIYRNGNKRLQELVVDIVTDHAAHIGTARMKSLTRQFVWWPKIDNDLESKIRSCNICQKFKGQLKWKIHFIFYNLDMLV